MKARLNFVAISVALAFAGHAQADLPSPAGLTDYSLWNAVFTDFDHQTELKAFQDFSYVAYDRLGGRSWGDTYLSELSKRWSELRAVECPKLTALCALPGSLADISTENQVLNSFTDEDFSRQLQSIAPSAGPLHYTLETVFYPELDPPTPYNVLASAGATQKSLSSIQAWDMSANDITETDHEYVVIQDQATYSAGYELADSHAFFGQDGQPGSGHYFLNLDLIKKNAEKFAQIWKLKAEIASAKDPTADWEARFLLTLQQKHQAEFEAKLQELSEKLRASTAENAAETSTRFGAEKAKGLYPLEVYQHVAYALFTDLVRTQAQYYLLADDGRIGVAAPFLAWESMLTLQAGAHSIEALYLAYSEAVIPSGLILSQYINASFGPLLFLEEINAILDAQDFAGKTQNFPRLKYALISRDLITIEFAKKIPALKALMIDARGNLKDLTKLDEATQKKALLAALYDTKGVYSTTLYRMMANLVSQLREDDAVALARQVHELKQGLFKNLP